MPLHKERSSAEQNEENKNKYTCDTHPLTHHPVSSIAHLHIHSNLSQFRHIGSTLQLSKKLQNFSLIYPE